MVGMITMEAFYTLFTVLFPSILFPEVIRCKQRVASEGCHVVIITHVRANSLVRKMEIKESMAKGKSNN
jgi:hypothetical protein